ncbi:hypothetical protein PHMEG_00026776 [Phytophthora megakarya]|uniref:Uncharacterized protein n=1 Tax=Phytophthora megakarya TaxID=4795 RepID=A0A225V9L1_9STRA|nr:hypothetical protein PHMEG_00026776 [Phytophthora megakarya]
MELFPDWILSSYAQLWIFRVTVYGPIHLGPNFVEFGRPVCFRSRFCVLKYARSPTTNSFSPIPVVLVAHPFLRLS